MLVGFVSGVIRADPVSVFIPLALLMLWPQLAMQIKRWHDIGLSGWMCVLSMIPFLGIIVVLGVGLVPGTKGDNRFGRDPLAPSLVSAGAL
jgi:uncharacterized membrane protein YhaH (DUF805 family)